MQPLALNIDNNISYSVAPFLTRSLGFSSVPSRPVKPVPRPMVRRNDDNSPSVRPSVGGQNKRQGAGQDRGARKAPPSNKPSGRDRDARGGRDRQQRPEKEQKGKKESKVLYSHVVTNQKELDIRRIIYTFI